MGIILNNLLALILLLCPVWLRAATISAQQTDPNEWAGFKDAPPTTNRSVAYVYSGDSWAASKFQAFLQGRGYTPFLLTGSAVVSTDYRQFDVIVIGPDTGFFSSWDYPEAIQNITASGKLIIGLGNGGYAFFGQLGLKTGNPHGWHGSEQGIAAVSPLPAVFLSPHTVLLGQGNSLNLYSSPVDEVGIYLPTVPTDVTPIAREQSNQTHYSLTLEQDHYFLWGFDGDPTLMTSAGQDLFDNVLQQKVPIISPPTPTPDNFAPEVNGWVETVAIQHDGKILLGGNFDTVCGQRREGIARLNGDGRLDAEFNVGCDGWVEALVVQADGKIILGGGFNALLGQRRDSLGRVDADGALDNAFDPRPNSSVRSLFMQADGKILVGGDFTTLCGQQRNGIGRLNADGTLDRGFNPGVTEYGTVHSLAVQPDGKILVGSSFTTLGGQLRTNLGRLSADGIVDSGFNPGVGGGSVEALAVQPDGKILVGGTFSMLSGQPRSGIGRLNADGTLDNDFNPGISQYDCVRSLVLQTDGKILVGGNFSTLGGQPRHFLGRVNADGTVDGAFNAEARNGFGVQSLAVQVDGKILVGGYFAVLGGQPRTHLGRLNNTELATQSLNYNSSSLTWLRGGTSPEVWRTTFEHTTDGFTWTNLGPGTRLTGGWQLNSVSVASYGTFRARGYITGAENTSGWFVEALIGGPIFIRQPFSRTNIAGSTATFNVLADGPKPLGYQWWKGDVSLIDSGDISGSATPTLTIRSVLKIHEGGYRVVITNAEGSATSLVARLTVQDPFMIAQPSSQQRSLGEAVAFSVTATGTSPFEYQWLKDAVALTQGTNASLTLSNLQRTDAGSYSVVVRNQYGSVTSAVALLQINLAIPDDAFNPEIGPLGSYVSALALQPDGKIVVGGGFTNICGQRRTGLARLNADGTLDPGFKPELKCDGREYDPGVALLIIQPDRKILLAGYFNLLDGQTRNGIGRLNPDGTLDTAFNPGMNDYGSVWSMALPPDGKILVGGLFTSFGGQQRTNIARLNADGTLDDAFNPGANSYVLSLALQPDGKILVGGNFSVLSGQLCSGIGRLNGDGTLDYDFYPWSNDDLCVWSLGLQPDGKILVGCYFDLLQGGPLSGIGRLNADGTLDYDFLPWMNENGTVICLALQTDGKILVGGEFTDLGGQARTNIGRLNGDGTLDQEYYPNANGGVCALALQTDGKILVGGTFDMLGGHPQHYFCRLNNSEPATQTLNYAGSTITWLRAGTSPEVWRSTFEHSLDGVTWTRLGEETRITDPVSGILSGWQRSDVFLPSTGTLRARGYVTSSGWFVESAIAAPWPIWLDLVPNGSNVVLHWTGGVGPYQVQQASNVGNSTFWMNLGDPVLTNSISVPVQTTNLFLRVLGQ